MRNFIFGKMCKIPPASEENALQHIYIYNHIHIIRWYGDVGALVSARTHTHTHNKIMTSHIYQLQLIWINKQTWMPVKKSEVKFDNIELIWFDRNFICIYARKKLFKFSWRSKKLNSERRKEGYRYYWWKGKANAEVSNEPI